MEILALCDSPVCEVWQLVLKYNIQQYSVSPPFHFMGTSIRDLEF